ncbi:xanthine dehydrogenase accessory protein XdhC [Amycolatopsis jejuensis]|uniref:xanthine dehydrogenase accessory protein XdhC n=1 Tax=Amycolatopsis jejuensis TaxID=330084 RepID=UPI0005270B82|nr:xanthine dehydrogenase accessory protein XdhC [Amycolatopsis jejuensis]
MNWLTAVQHLREAGLPGVLVTVTAVRGHAPREGGAKMVVGESECHGTIGGGNAEAVAVDRARELLRDNALSPETITLSLSDKAPYQHGVQCCGGTMTLLFEPLPVRPAVAIFGVGHVGLELARILARHEVSLHLVDSRPEQLTPERLDVLSDAVASVHVHRIPLLPETVLSTLPAGTHVLIMTHDHAEDIALCDAALRNGTGGSIGLIGSAGKWSRFRKRLTDLGHEETALSRITTPIGIPEITGKDPAVIAVSVAAALLQQFTSRNPERKGEFQPSLQARQ